MLFLANNIKLVTHLINFWININEMKIYISIIAILLFSACQNSEKKAIQDNSGHSFFVGTYTDGESEGIYKYFLKEDGTFQKIGLVARTNNPSFLAKTADNQFLLAVNEIDKNGVGGLESFLINGDSLEFISRGSSGGAHPCFVSINTAGFVLVTNYTGGNIGLLKLNTQGELTALLDVEQHFGKGSTERQQEAHAHSAWFTDDNKIIAADLGTNELWFSDLDEQRQKLIPTNPQKLSMNQGAGPRHLAFHPNGEWIYVLNELDCTISLIQQNANDNYKLGKSISTLPDDFEESNASADIHISSDGKFLYASNRGHNSIAIYKVISDGTLNLLGFESSHGEGPRNFSFSPDEEYLVIANQYTKNIVSLKRDKKTGLLSYISQIEAPSPVCIVF